MSKRLFSASELADLKLPGIPTARQKCSEFISRVANNSPELVAQRQGRGGGWLVDITALPDAAQAELKVRDTKRALTFANAQGEADAIARDKRQMAVTGAVTLTARQRMVMDARHGLILAIEAEVAVTGTSREAVLRHLIDGCRSGTLDPDRQSLVRRANDKAGNGAVKISRATLFEWLKAYEARGAIGLAPSLTKQKQPNPDWFEGFLKHRQKMSKPSDEEALRAFNRERPAGTPLIRIDQVRRALKKLSHFERAAGREGKLALRAKMAYVARDFSDLLPTSVYVADGKTFDAEIAHPIHGQPFRPELSSIIDVATRRVVGWSASLDENTFGVVDALRQSCAFGGIPAIFYTDRGPGYKNKAFDSHTTGFLRRAGITPMRALPYNSQAKGVVERLNQVYTATAKSLPTYIGKDMDKEAKLVAFKQTRRDLAFTGNSRMLCGWDRFIDLINETLASYNDRPHSGLPKFVDPQLGRSRHLTPNEAWQAKCTDFEPIIPTTEELDDMFRPYVLRKTARGLVDWLGNSYFAIELEKHYGEQVAVGYDIKDASKVWVRELEDINGDIQPGKLIATAVFEGHKTRYVPLSYEQAASERRAKGRLARVGRKIDEIKAELDTPLLDLKAEPAPIIPAFEYRQSEPVVAAPLTLPATAEPAAEQATNTASGQVRRPRFHDDVSFANWLVEHPDQADADDKVLLRDLLTTHSSNELLRMSGVDLVALRSLARSPSVPSGASNGDNT